MTEFSMDFEFVVGTAIEWSRASWAILPTLAYPNFREYRNLQAAWIADQPRRAIAIDDTARSRIIQR
jgi:hypothetical protein